jgi:hypothetical protein
MKSRYAAVFALFMPLTMIGCQTMSFEDELGRAYLTVSTVAKTAEERCAAAEQGGPCTGTITTKQRDQVRDALSESLVYLDAARTTQSTDQIARARSVLAIATAILEEKQ